MFYILNLVIFLVLAVLINLSYLSGKKKKHMLLFFGFLHLFFIHAFKDPMAFNDTPHYALAYDIMCKTGLVDYFKFANIKSSEISYAVLMYISSLISTDTQFIFVITSFLILSGYFFVIKKYSVSIWLSIFLFYIIDFKISLIVLRQFCALAVIAYALPYIEKRNFKKFAICQLVAFFFHFTSIVFFPMYIAYGFNLSERKFQRWIFLLLTLVGGIFFRAIYSYFGLSDDFGYESYMEVESGGANSKMFFLLLIVFYLFCIAYKKRLFSDYKNRLIFYLLYIGTCIAFFGIGLTATSRMNLYYSSFALILALPKLIKSNITYVKIAGFIIIMALSYFYGKNLAYLEQDNMVYKFCF